MTGHPRNLSVVMLCILILSSFGSAQKHPDQAEENPLSTGLYLLSTTDKDDDEDEKACLAKSLGKVDRFDDIRAVGNMIEGSSYIDVEFISIVRGLIQRNKLEEASSLLSYVLNKFGDDEYNLKLMIESIIRLKRDAELGPLIEKIDDSDKIDLWIESAKVYRERGELEAALRSLEKAVALALVSKYTEDRAELGLSYAKLGREVESLRFIRAALDELQWKSGEPEYTEGRVIDRAIEAYELLDKQADARALVERQGKEYEPSILASVELNIRGGERRKALAKLDRAVTLLNPKEYADCLELNRVAKAYLKLGETKKAEAIAKSVGMDEELQLWMLIALADHFKKASNRSRAHHVLQFALEKTDGIDISEKESGQFWTSAKWDQAKYQSQIAIRLMDLKFEKEALQLTRRLTKPYLKALTLTEYVAISKNRLPSKHLSPYLEEAVLLLRQPKTDVFDSKKFDVYAITARSFAEIGLPARANEVFAETLTKLDQEVIEYGSDGMLLFAMCNIGVDFERSKIKADENVKTALRKIIRNWENDEY